MEDTNTDSVQREMEDTIRPDIEQISILNTEITNSERQLHQLKQQLKELTQNANAEAASRKERSAKVRNRDTCE